MKLKYVASLSIALMLAAGLTGCGGAKAKPLVSKLSMSKSVSEKRLNLKFPKKDPLTNEKIEFDINDNLSSKHNKRFMGMKYNLGQDDFERQIENLSQYKHKKIKNTKDSGGIRLDFDNNKISFIYERGRWIGRAAFYTKTVFDVNYKQDSMNDIVFSAPSTYISYPRSTIFKDIEVLDKKENLAKDFKNVFNNLDKVVFLLLKEYKLHGEVNTQYPARSIYSNIKRNMKAASKQRSQGTDTFKNTFKLNMDGKEYDLDIEVYPYKNGSKVVYKTTIDYSISSAGKCDLDKNTINNIRTKIESIIKS